MATEFLTGLKDLQDYFKSTASSVWSTFDRLSYGMLVDCLKAEDAQAVKDAIDQLVKEGNPVCIPPLYFVSVAHPIPWVRDQAAKAIKKLVATDELNKIIAGKDTKAAVRALVDKYGHFRK